MHAPKRLATTRIVAKPAALDSLSIPEGHTALRTAEDELMVFPPLTDVAIDDQYAIIIRDASFASVTLPTDEAMHFLEHACEWELPAERPAFTQGAVAGLATKLWLEEAHVQIIVSAAHAYELEERLG